MISTQQFYGQWSGHPIHHLKQLLSYLKQKQNPRRIIYFAGDSSLDNKYWVPETAQALNGYEKVLSPNESVQDVCFWMNKLLIERKLDIVAVNAAVEATTVRERKNGRSLLPHDIFIQDNITEDDILIVSVGGNDIAMDPTMSTVCHMAGLIYLSCIGGIENSIFLSHFVSIFHDQVQNYITSLVAKKKPKAVLVNMIYYPLMEKTDSWANQSLSALQYQKKPHLLQTAIDVMYERATCNINIPGTTIIPIHLGKILDGKNIDEYSNRVEPSALGGEKMAQHFMEQLDTLLK